MTETVFDLLRHERTVMAADDEKARLYDDSDNKSDSDMDDEKTQLTFSADSSPSLSRSPTPTLEEDSRFAQPAPSKFKRAGLLIFVGILLWLAFQMRSDLLEASRKPQIIHASRYSKEHKFRPAASPIITETLKDGRIRLRGALQTPTATPTPVVKKKKKPSAGKMSGKKKKTGKKSKGSNQGIRM